MEYRSTMWYNTLSALIYIMYGKDIRQTQAITGYVPHRGKMIYKKDKKLKKIKILSLVMAVLISITALVSCSGRTAVITIAGTGITQDVYRYIVLNCRRDIETAYSEDVWETGDAGEAKEELCRNIADYMCTLCTICALGRDYGIEWNSQEVLAQVEITKFQYTEELGGEEAFEEELGKMYMTEDVFEFIAAVDILKGEIYGRIAESDEKYTDKEYLSDLFASDDLIRIKQILIGGENAGTDEENLKTAGAIHDRLMAGEDFDDLVSDVNYDLYMFNNPDGYYIMKGTRDKAFEEAAFSLEEGEISEVTKTSSGYSIIKRYEKDPEYIEKNFDSLTDEFYETLYTRAYEEKYPSVRSEVTTVPMQNRLLDIRW